MLYTIAGGIIVRTTFNNGQPILSRANTPNTVLGITNPNNYVNGKIKNTVLMDSMFYVEPYEYVTTIVPNDSK